MVGRGFLRVDLNKIRSDCPKSLKRLLMDCINFHRDERPLFQQVADIHHVLLFFWYSVNVFFELINLRFNRLENSHLTCRVLLQILAEMDSLIQSLPKIHRSTSEPVSLNRTRFSSEDGVFMSNGSPDTPIHSPYVGSSFPFFQNVNVNSHYWSFARRKCTRHHSEDVKNVISSNEESENRFILLSVDDHYCQRHESMNLKSISSLHWYQSTC